MRRTATRPSGGSPAPVRVVCAPNAFKGTLRAPSAAAAMARGVRDAGAHAVEVPVADGGDGTLEVLLAAGSEARISRHRVTGPAGTPVVARLGWLGRDHAVIELAEASGLRRLGTRSLDPLHATSRGAGELIRIAVGQGARTIVVGVGGSACTDGGTGLLQALGARLTNSRGEDIAPGGAGLEYLATIDLSAAIRLLSGCSIDVACDVRGPLLGAHGAARMFGPQKGAGPEDVRRLEGALRRFAALAAASNVGDLSRLPGAGAAGGCGFGLALLGARLVSGASLVCNLIHLDSALAGAALVLTGEGRLDDQTRDGKAPAEVAARAQPFGIPCVAIAGAVLDPLPELFASTIALDALDAALDPRRHVRALLRKAAARAVTDLRARAVLAAAPY